MMHCVPGNNHDCLDSALFTFIAAGLTVGGPAGMLPEQYEHPLCMSTVPIPDEPLTTASAGAAAGDCALPVGGRAGGAV